MSYLVAIPNSSLISIYHNISHYYAIPAIYRSVSAFLPFFEEIYSRGNPYCGNKLNIVK
jgi:hypothetical protein